MPDRADYLARQLLTRADAFETHADPTAGREQLVTKLLATEAGITDGATVRLVAEALPAREARRRAPDRERDALARFLRERLGARLDLG